MVVLIELINVLRTCIFLLFQSVRTPLGTQTMYLRRTCSELNILMLEKSVVLLMALEGFKEVPYILCSKVGWVMNSIILGCEKKG